MLGVTGVSSYVTGKVMQIGALWFAEWRQAPVAMKSGPRRTALLFNTPSARRNHPPRARTSRTWTWDATPKVPWIWIFLLITLLIGTAAATDLHKLEDTVDSVLANDRTLRLSKSLTLEALDVNKTRSALNISDGDVLNRVIDKLEVIATTHALRVRLPKLSDDVRALATRKYVYRLRIKYSKRYRFNDDIARTWLLLHCYCLLHLSPLEFCPPSPRRAESMRSNLTVNKPDAINALKWQSKLIMLWKRER